MHDAGLQVTVQSGRCRELRHGFDGCEDEDGPAVTEDAAEVQDEGDEVGAEAALDYDGCFVGDGSVEGSFVDI